MAQTITFEDDLQTTVDFQDVTNGDIFIYNNQYCVKMDNNNPNYVIIDLETDNKDRLDDTDQVIWPDEVLLKVE